MVLFIFIFIMSSLNGALATVAKNFYYYDDTVPETSKRVCDNTFGDLQSLRVTYSMGEGIVLITGVNFSYNNNGASGPHSVNIEFLGDSSIAQYSDTGIPHVGQNSWRVFYCDGPDYIIDDDPIVNFIGTQPSTNAILLHGDTGITGHSYYNIGAGWVLDTYEYLVKIIYENITSMNFTETKSGQITTTDIVDAYYVNLTEGIPYVFVLDRTVGTGNFTMRLVANQEITNITLSTSTETGNPRYLGYTSPSNSTYILLVEAVTRGIDTGTYNLSYFIDTPPSSNQPGNIVTTKTGTETIDWYLYDDYGGGHYQILQNNTPASWIPWINNTNLHVPINRSAPGVFNYTIAYNDTGGFFGLPSTVWITILDSPPTSDQPSDIIAAVNSSKTIPWVITDDFGAGFYRVFVNFTPGVWQPWINNTAVNYPINTSVPGIFEYVIQFNDSKGQLGFTDSVIVTLIVDAPPESTQPDNMTKGVNNTVYIDWVLTDAIGEGYYRVVVNNTPGVWDTWINSTSVHYLVNTSVGGIFKHTIEYNDSIGQFGNPSTVYVWVIGDWPPTSNQPNNVTTTKTGIETIDWELYDDIGESYYRVLINSNPGNWDTWINNTNLQYPIDRSAPGLFNYTIMYNDTGNNWGAPSTVFVTVLDSSPTSDQPSDKIVPVNSTKTIPWVLTDDFGAGFYRVFVNFTPGVWQPWINNTPVNYPINTSVPGIYEYVIQYNDSAGNLGTTDLVLISIVVDVPPEANQPSNVTIGIDYTVDIDWFLTDDKGEGYYRVFVNGTPSDWAPWINNTSVNYPINTTLEGIFNYTIQYNDSLGQEGIPSTVFITIISDFDPYSNHPANITTDKFGLETIDWYLWDDLGGSYYRVLVNSSPGSWVPWSNNTNLQFPIDRMAPGIYNYTILYNDTGNNWGPVDTVWVMILDYSPYSNQPSNITTFKSGVETIEWYIYDDFGGSYYQVLINQNPGNWMPWTNGTNLHSPIDRSVPGIYNYTIRYNDTFGIWGVPDTVWVTIVDNIPTSNHPGNVTADANSSASVPWILMDDYGEGFYRVLINGTPGEWQPWINGTSINYFVNTTIPGAYEYLIQYNDSAGQWGVPDIALVVIKEALPPVLATSDTQVNLTCILEGISVGDENGFAITVDGWNSTYLGLDISEVMLYDYILGIEEHSETGNRADISTQQLVMSFQVSDDCYLQAIDFIYAFPWQLFPPANRPVNVIIYNSTYSPTRNNAVPDKVIYNSTDGDLTYTYDLGAPLNFQRWVSVNDPDWDGTLSQLVTLDTTKTYNNVFFIGLNATESVYWYRDADAGDPDGDSGVAYTWTGGQWINTTNDYTLRVSLKPIVNKTTPYNIGMTINTKPISSMGKWNDTSFINSQGAISYSFNISSSWYNIGYLVNWTAYLQNITMGWTTVYAQALKSKVLWEVSIPATFVGGSFNKTIEVFIPTSWNITKVFKGSVEYSDWEEHLSNPKKSVLIREASDDLWRVRCDGHNWISYISTNKAEIFVFDKINVTAHLIYPVYDMMENARLNVTDDSQKFLNSFLSRGFSNDVNFTWSVSQTIHTNGDYNLLVTWFNGTEAGIWTTTIHIINSTSLQIIYPPHVGNIIEVSRGSVFNVILYYNMSYWTNTWDSLYLEDVMGASVTYSYMGLPSQPMSKLFYLNHNGWRTQLTAPLSVGDYPLFINASAWGDVQNYTNYFIIIRVAQHETQLIFNDTAKQTFWNTSIAFTFSYINLTAYPIVADNISVQWRYDYDTLYRGYLSEGWNYTVTYNGGTGEYTIIFANFSAHTFKLLFYIDASTYQGQDAYLTLIFNNRSTELTQQTSIPRILYQTNGEVLVSLFYRDILSNIGLSGALIQSNWSLINSYSAQDLSGGYYAFRINVSYVGVNNYTILVSASNVNYETAILILHLEIYGYPTTINALSGQNLTGLSMQIYAMENWTISFEYRDIMNNVGITNATISASLGGIMCVWNNSVSGNYTVWVDTNQLATPMAGKSYPLEITIGKTFYEWQIFTITVNVIALPSQLFPIKTSLVAEIKDFIQIEVQLNDTYNLQGISGIIWYQIQNKTYQMVPSATLGWYYTIINLTNYNPGTYSIQINSWAIDYQNASTMISLKVKFVNYSLILSMPSHANAGNNLTLRVSLFNGTHYISGAMINVTLQILLQNDTIIMIKLSGLTATNGTATFIYLIPAKTVALYVSASYEREGGAMVYSDVRTVSSVDPWVFFLESWFLTIIIVILLGYLLILGVYVYRTKIRPRFMSVEAKKRELMKRRAENRREITEITQEIQQLRAETLKEADSAKANLDFGKAGKLYEKAGNLTLELADKSVAREFFLKSKEMQKQSDQKERQNEMKDRREKLLEKARVAIRERDVIEAARNYREVAEISRILGERDQADKFLKLANAAHERIEALKEGDLRKKSGIFLSKADKAMGKQDFLDAARNFEEAAKIMVVLGEEDGVNRFAGWAKLARERNALVNEKPREYWMEELREAQKTIMGKAKLLVREKKFDDAINEYTTLVVYSVELGEEEKIEKLKKNIEFCRNQASITEISPETRSLINERKKLLVKVDEAVKSDRFATAARYYGRIAQISEIIDGKEVARTYKKQENYYLTKAQEKQLAEKEKEMVEERAVEKFKPKAIIEISEDEIEKTRSELAETVRSARNALKTDKNILARELYEKAANIATMLKDKESAQRYKQKAEEIGILKAEKPIESEGVIRRKIAELMQKVEKSLQKKKYQDAKDAYEEISELFIQLGEDDAANEFLEKANSMRRLIK